jgi:hypothetical protein
MMANRFPGRAPILATVARQRREAGRLNAADAVIAAALAQLPDSQVLLVESPLVALARGDLHETARRWRVAIDRHPNWPEPILAHNAIQSAIAAREFDATAEDPGQGWAARQAFLLTRQNDADALRELFMRFESLGSDCQFGFLQREFGAEPLGILRFGGISAANLVRALDNDLVELMEADDARFIPHPVDYQLEVPRAGFDIHTLIVPEDPDAFLVQMRRRLRYLSRKLLEDLQDGEKIFVFKSYDLTEEELVAVRRAVRRHGQGQLLFVRRPDADHPTGSVEPGPDRTWLGYIEPGGAKDKPFRDAWVKVCGTIAATLAAAPDTADMQLAGSGA